MKQPIIAFIICSTLITPSAVNACEGVIVKGKYCLSKNTMNYYTAYAWCDAQNMKLVDLPTVCGSYNSCPPLKLTDTEKQQIKEKGGSVAHVLTNTSKSTSAVYGIKLTDASLYDYGFDRSGTYGGVYALCQ